MAKRIVVHTTFQLWNEYTTSLSTLFLISLLYPASSYRKADVGKARKEVKLDLKENPNLSERDEPLYITP
jgi:hypothetical protein